jgi:predicted nucleotide-binding protein (sugar kinase/HSP70/actin superfamily)
MTTTLILLGVLTWGIAFPWLALRNSQLREANAELKKKAEFWTQKTFILKRNNDNLRKALRRVLDSEVVRQAPMSSYSEAIHEAKQLVIVGLSGGG